MRRTLTREWWKYESDHFEVWASATTHDELAAGTYRRQLDCVRFVRKLPYLNVTREAYEIAKHLVERGVVPAEKPIDALQMGICAAHRIDNLLSWNYSHLVNPIAQRNMEEACESVAVSVPGARFA